MRIFYPDQHLLVSTGPQASPLSCTLLGKPRLVMQSRTPNLHLGIWKKYILMTKHWISCFVGKFWDKLLLIAVHGSSAVTYFTSCICLTSHISPSIPSPFHSRSWLETPEPNMYDLPIGFVLRTKCFVCSWSPCMPSNVFFFSLNYSNCFKEK